jgi:hypothetical protein
MPERHALDVAIADAPRESQRLVEPLAGALERSFVEIEHREAHRDSQSFPYPLAMETLLD